MTTQLQEPIGDVALAADHAQALLQPARVRISTVTARRLATAGGFGVVWLPVYALLVGDVRPLSLAVGASLLIAAVWFTAMRAAFAAGRLTMLTLGPAVAAAVGTVTGAIAASGAALWVPALNLGPVDLLQMALAIFVFSAMWEAVVLRSSAARRRVLIVGAGDGGAELVEDMALAESLPFDLVGLVDDERQGETVAGAPLHGRLADLAAIVEAQRPDLVVLASGEERAEAFEHLLDAASVGFKIVGLPEFYELAFGRVPVRNLAPSWFMGVLHLYHRPYTRLAKRVFDVVVACVGLLLTGWTFPLLAFLVKRTPGPVVFKQVRLGEGGKHFTIYKFRTMRVDAEAQGAMWASERDPRITTTGRIMRKTRLDELPQLWNVLKGDMSIVGPRPERPEFVEELREAVPFWTRRHLVKPGITGWAQVRRGYTADASGTEEKLSYDLWYLRHRSLVVDLAICTKTFTTLVTGSGAR